MAIKRNLLRCDEHKTKNRREQGYEANIWDQNNENVEVRKVHSE